MDELNLITFPVVLGGGKRLFEGGASASAFALADSRVTGRGVVVSVFRRAGRPAYGNAALDL